MSRENENENVTAGIGSVTETPVEIAQPCEDQPCEDQPCEPELEPVPTEEIASPQSMREIHITPLHYGYNVKLGCSTFAVETKASLIAKLTAYINDPAGVENKWHRTGEL